VFEVHFGAIIRGIDAGMGLFFDGFQGVMTENIQVVFQSQCFYVMPVTTDFEGVLFRE
jgi:hypothetical protein